MMCHCGCWKMGKLHGRWTFSSVTMDGDEVGGDPGVGAHDEGVLAGVGDANLAPDESKQPVKKGVDSKALRLKCANGIFTAAAVMCKDMIQPKIRLLVTMIRPVRTEHALNARQCRGPRDVK